MGVSTGQNSVGSRCATPLSRQNSMSMEDFTTSMPALSSANGPRGGADQRVSSSARFRRSNPGSPRKSVSIDSLSQHAASQGYFGGSSDGLDTAQSSRQSSAGTGHYHHGLNNHQHHMQQQQIKAPEYALDTYIPGNSTVQGHPQQSNGYYQPEPPRSNPGSPSKRVAFKGLPNQYNHPGTYLLLK